MVIISSMELRAFKSENQLCYVFLMSQMFNSLFSYVVPCLFIFQTGVIFSYFFRGKSAANLILQFNFLLIFTKHLMKPVETILTLTHILLMFLLDHISNHKALFSTVTLGAF